MNSAAIVKLNDPFSDAQAITDAVEAGYVVRTRADTPISQAQSGDTAMQRAAFASGAQWVSTDYPVPGLTELLGTYGLPFADYVSPLPPNESPPGESSAALRSPLSFNAKAAGPDRVARCNPVSAPAFCYDVALTEPEPPAPPPVVRGQELREVLRDTPVQQLIWAYAWLLGAVVLAGMAWQTWRVRRSRIPSSISLKASA